MTIKRYEHGGNFLKEKERESAQNKREANQRAKHLSRIGDGAEYKEILSWEMRCDERTQNSDEQSSGRARGEWNECLALILPRGKGANDT